MRHRSRKYHLSSDEVVGMAVWHETLFAFLHLWRAAAMQAICRSIGGIGCEPIRRPSNLDLSAKFHHISRGHAEEGCGAFGGASGDLQSSCDRDVVVHEAEVENDARNTLDQYRRSTHLRELN